MSTSMGALPITVASIPAGHVYVRHLAAPDGDDGVVRLADIRPEDGAQVPGGWWPPVMLDPDWIRTHHASFDVFHVHFGFDAKRPDELAEIVGALREVGRPLVVTVHDLRNPHHDDPRLHAAQLEVLVRHADELITLTTGAADEVRRRWGRHCTVLAHPHVLEPAAIAAGRRDHEGFVVGLHAKSVRANMDPVGVASALSAIVADLPGARLQINLHDEVLDPANHWHAPELAEQLAAIARDVPHVDLRIHPYFDDEELWEYLRDIDVSVLPYRFGTHSGWLEGCFDLGTTVVAPGCGFYGEQSPCLVYGHDELGIDAPSLRAAITTAHAAWAAGTSPARADVESRMRQRQSVAAAHRAIYDRAIGQPGGTAAPTPSSAWASTRSVADPSSRLGFPAARAGQGTA